MPKKIFNSDLETSGGVKATSLTDGTATLSGGVLTASTLTDGTATLSGGVLTSSHIVAPLIEAEQDGDLNLRADDSVIITIDYDEDAIEAADYPAYIVNLRTEPDTDYPLVDANQYYTNIKGNVSGELLLAANYSALRSNGNVEIGIDTGDNNSNEEFVIYRGSTNSYDDAAVELFRVDKDGVAYIDSGDIRIYRSAVGTEFISQSKGIRFHVDEPEVSTLDFFSFSTSDETIATINSDGLLLNGAITSVGKLILDASDQGSSPSNGGLTLLGIPQEASDPDQNSHFLTINAVGQVQYTQVTQFTGTHLYPCSADLPKGSSVVLTSDGEAALATDSNSNKCVGIVVGEYLDSTEVVKDSLGNSHQPDRDYALYLVAAVGDSRHKGCQGFNVCNENGDIQPGDLLVTSSTPGYLMKQDDDIIRSKTVGKAMEAVTFDANGQATGIYGFIYCG